MATISRFERDLIAAFLPHSTPSIEPGVALVLMPDTVAHRNVYSAAISPALADCGFRLTSRAEAFDSYSSLELALRCVSSAEVIVADVTAGNGDVLYLLGLCHGLGRNPLLISQDPATLPLGLTLMRCVEYVDDPPGHQRLCEHLTRAVRVFLAAADASRREDERQ
ncbi:MAG TPA: hypothetical protein VG269_08515 [Tepidisphaeraceae bacterium]|jgi:hypothetical protein|nr:hypothetical protein [Tepidisphaeraceae bacterium]